MQYQFSMINFTDSGNHIAVPVDKALAPVAPTRDRSVVGQVYFHFPATEPTQPNNKKKNLY